MKFGEAMISLSRIPISEDWRHAVNILQANGQVHFRNILFATDFSDAMQLALPYAVEFAAKFAAKINVVHVIPEKEQESFSVPHGEFPGDAQNRKEYRQNRQRELEAELQNIPHAFMFPEGEVWENLSRIIDEQRIDLLVLGTHGRTGIGRTLFGSVAERIFRQAPCPVLTVGPRVFLRDDLSANSEFHCVLYATDFSPESLAAARYATFLAKQYRATLVLMHSIQKPEPGQVNCTYQSLREVVPLGAGLQSSPRCIVERGTPAESVLGVSMREGADLIVLGIPSAEISPHAASRAAMASIKKILTQAECPVLTVRS